MSSSAAQAAVAEDAAEGAAAAAAAHAPGMDDRLAALKAERQALKRQLAAGVQSRSQGTGWAGYNFILVCHICMLGVSRADISVSRFAPSFCRRVLINICLAEVALNLHRITCLFTLSISFQSCGRRRNAAGC